MNLKHVQAEVDQWIKEIGVRYFDIQTNTILLNEEVGEFSGLVARVYGEQSFKNTVTEEEGKQLLQEELGDVLFVLVCLANQMDFDLADIFRNNIDKKTRRDAKRHRDNPKLNQ